MAQIILNYYLLVGNICTVSLPYFLCKDMNMGASLPMREKERNESRARKRRQRSQPRASERCNYLAVPLVVQKLPIYHHAVRHSASCAAVLPDRVVSDDMSVARCKLAEYAPSSYEFVGLCVSDVGCIRALLKSPDGKRARCMCMLACCDAGRSIIDKL